VAVSPDGRQLATGAKDGTIKIWDARPQRAPDRLWDVLKAHGRVHFAPGAERFLTLDAKADGSVITAWDSATVTAFGQLRVEDDLILDAALLGAGPFIALVRKDESFELRDLANPSWVQVLLPPSDKRPAGWALRVSIPWIWEIKGGVE
jgi:WD40 repeat protein